MANVDDYDFSSTDAGASTTYPMEAGQIRKGGFIVIKGHPCKVVSVSTSKTGKHGHAKCNFTALDIFTGKKYEDIVPSTHTTMVPNVVRTEFQLVDITDEGFVSLMDDTGEIREDLKMPEKEELASQIQAAFDEGKDIQLIVQKSMDIEQVIEMKEVKI